MKSMIDNYFLSLAIDHYKLQHGEWIEDEFEDIAQACGCTVRQLVDAVERAVAQPKRKRHQ